MARRNTKAADEFTEDTPVETEGHDLLDDLSFEEPPARTRSPRTAKWAKVLDTLGVARLGWERERPVLLGWNA